MSVFFSCVVWCVIPELLRHPCQIWDISASACREVELMCLLFTSVKKHRMLVCTGSSSVALTDRTLCAIAVKRITPYCFEEHF